MTRFDRCIVEKFFGKSGSVAEKMKITVVAQVNIFF
jgi:hypothetical protein